jgi:glutaconate CoA-transferase subunit A
LAASTLIITVEEIVESLAAPMNAIVLPHWVVTAIAVVPMGAYPSYAHGYYARDNAFYRAWDEIARDRERFTAWITSHVLCSRNHTEFLDSLAEAA